MTIETLKKEWEDTNKYHLFIKDLFTQLTDFDEKLKEHRDFVEGHVYGFGERCFWYLWKILLEELPDDAKLLEIGVFKGATLSLWQLLKPGNIVYGVTPLDSTGIGWEGDYRQLIADIHDRYNQKMPIIIEGLSATADCIETAKRIAPYDVVYIDGDHSYNGALSDLINYAPMVKPGGFLVMDDCNCDMKMPWGFFQGIEDVTRAKLDWLKTTTEWDFICSVVHISVFKRV